MWWMLLLLLAGPVLPDAVLSEALRGVRCRDGSQPLMVTVESDSVAVHCPEAAGGMIVTLVWPQPYIHEPEIMAGRLIAGAVEVRGCSEQDRVCYDRRPYASVSRRPLTVPWDGRACYSSDGARIVCEP